MPGAGSRAAARGHCLGRVSLKGKGEIEVYRCEGVDA